MSGSDDPLVIEVPGYVDGAVGTANPDLHQASHLAAQLRGHAVGALGNPEVLLAVIPTGATITADGWQVRDREEPLEAAAHIGADWSKHTAAEAQVAGVAYTVLCRDGWYVPAR